MRFGLLFLTLALSLNGGMAEAAGKKAKGKKKDKAAAESGDAAAPADADGDAAGASAAARANRKFGSGLLLTPASDFVLQYGATGYYMLSPDLHVGFDFLMGSEDIVDKFDKQGTIEVTEASLSGMAAFGFGRYFFGNSFNAMGGLGLRTASASLLIEDKATGEFFDSQLDVSTVILPVAIGNHWSFDGGFTIGVDWVTVLVALSGSAKTDSSSNIADPGVDALFDDFQALGDDLANTTSLTLALTTIGWQF